MRIVNYRYTYKPTYNKTIKKVIRTYYHSSSQSKEITTLSKDMSVSSLGAKINSEENSPLLPEFSNCYFEKL